MINRAAAGVALTCLLAVACSCASVPGPGGGRAGEGPGARAPSSGATVAPAVGDGRARGFDLVNYSGSTFRAVYVSPSDSKGWEENVLGEEMLADGDAVNIGFSPEEKAVLWDIRVVATDEHYAEWKGLDLRDASRITLLLKLAGEPVVVAEVE